MVYNSSRSVTTECNIRVAYSAVCSPDLNLVAASGPCVFLLAQLFKLIQRDLV